MFKRPLRALDARAIVVPRLVLRITTMKTTEVRILKALDPGESYVDPAFLLVETHFDDDGEPVTNVAAHKLVARGLAHVPEGRMIFANLTVMENLRMGAYLRRDSIQPELDYAFGIFPRLKERVSQIAASW